MKKTQKEIEPNSVFIREPFSCWDSKLKKGFVWAEVNCILYDFENCWNRQPAVNELLNLHNIRVDEEFLHVFYDILCRFTGLRWLTKQQMCVILTKHTKILPRGKNISLIIWGAKRAILDKYWGRRWNWLMHNRTYNPVGLIKVSHFSRGGRAPSRLPMKKLKSLLGKTRQVRLFVSKGILKITPYSLPCKQ